MGWNAMGERQELSEELFLVPATGSNRAKGVRSPSTAKKASTMSSYRGYSTFPSCRGSLTLVRMMYTKRSMTFRLTFASADQSPVAGNAWAIRTKKSW